MHGELMEFNETLQKQLISRETHLKRLTEEVISLRGPVCVFFNENYKNNTHFFMVLPL